METLHFSALYRPCDPSALRFESTEELEPLSAIVGQESALSAVDFGINIAQEGYNLYAMGPSGSGKHSVIASFLGRKAAEGARPDDWCYVNNFHDYHAPTAIRLPPGEAARFRDDIVETIELLKTILPSVFESNEYRNTREAVNQKYISLQAEIFENLQKEAERHSVAMNAASPGRVTFVPVVEGKVLSAEEFQAIGGEEKEKLTANLNAFEGIVKEGLREVSRLSRSLQKELMALDRKTTEDAVETVLEEVRESYREIPKIVSYIDALQEDVIRSVQDFLVKPEEMEVPPFMREYVTPTFRRYQVNVLISRPEEEASPVIYEDNPICQNLIGRIEHISQMGTLLTDFTMIKPGALHKANGGYLILDAFKLLTQPYAWDALKRALRSREIRIESVAQHYSLIDTTTLEPEPVPLDVKVVLIGERMLYYLLYYYDPDFKELFKVCADFEEEMPRTDENSRLFAQMIGTIARKGGLLSLEAEAVGRIIEHAAREAGDSMKISTHIGTLSDLLKESDYQARASKQNLVRREDVESALRAQRERVSRVQKKLYELIDEGTIRINIRGDAVGQVNALSYISLGHHRFGVPSRVTARTRLGKGEIIDIERQSELGGPIHTKGVMILGSYLESTYAREAPFNLHASLVFEQSYVMVDGDSASSAELYAILSSLADVPIAQNIAVTGSVNQFGEIQAIGGVNEKIEGFFDVCIRRDPLGEYGVMIPQANVRHLMLKAEVVDAAKEGRFSIYAVSTVAEGIEILSGLPAGEADAGGIYPSGSLNAKIASRLNHFAKTAQEYGRGMAADRTEEGGSPP